MMNGNAIRSECRGSGIRRRATLSVIAFGLLAAGCLPRVDLNTRYTATYRAEKGLVAILPGIEGESLANRNIRKGLDDAGIPYALAIYRWGFPIPGIGMLVNQTDTGGNRRAATKLAERIARYQRNYPGRPIFIVGHSGGGGIAVFALEALGRIPGAKPIEGAFLLSASISADYPLASALRMTRRGLVNVSNPEDRLLGAGTAVIGNVDGGHGDSAGRTGFLRRYPKVFERRITAASLGVMELPHFAATNARAISQRGPAWLRSQTWPPSTLR